MKKSEALDFQVALFDRIFNQADNKSDIINELTEVLACSRSSLFRKRAGSTPLSNDELFRLADHFHYSIDEMRGGVQSTHILFKSQNRITNYTDLEIYISQTLGNLAVSQMVPDSHLYYSAKDLPLFDYFADPFLAAFKAFVWVEETAKTQEVFNARKIPPSLIEKGNQLYNLYLQMPTSEIWSEHTIDNLVDQIKHFWRTERITDGDAQKLFDSLENVVNLTEKRAANQSKVTGKPFQLYWCPFIMGANSGLLSVGETVITYLGYSAINYLMSSHPSVGDNIKKAFYYQSSEGVSVTGLAEEKRNEFFGLLRSKISEAREIKKT
ncbi:MAG: hypothetical protein SchgKO_11840 [Schleiferiaceae bacterium]